MRLQTPAVCPLGLNADVAHAACSVFSPSISFGLYPDTKKAASLPLPSLINAFLARIVRLDSLRLNDHGRVGFLPVLGLGGDRSCHVARTQSERCSQRRQRCDQYGNDDFDDLLFGHNGCDFCLTMDNINDETGHVSPCIA